jgi:endonuclease G
MRATISAICLVFLPFAAHSQSHFFSGQPACNDLHARIGYVLCYDATRRVPDWVAYRVEPAFRDTPERKGKYKSFRTDPDVSNPVKDDDYDGLFNSRGYARGHLAPYAVMGGARDDDGQTAEDDDPEDNLTIFQANFMSNITPQHHHQFNGSGGLWFELERFIQDELVDDQELTVWVYAGIVFGAGTPEKVGPNDDIHVPPMFYKFVTWIDPDVDEPVFLAFLFPHQRTSHGDIDDFLVSIDVIEALTGHDFFAGLADSVENAVEDADTFDG